jgi:hypothetical protein
MAFIVVIAHSIDPSLVEDMQHYVTNVTRVLSDMAAKGNAMAHLREKELTLLQKMKEAVIGRETGRPGRPDLTPYPSSTIHAFSPSQSTGEWAGAFGGY